MMSESEDEMDFDGIQSGIATPPPAHDSGRIQIKIPQNITRLQQPSQQLGPLGIPIPSYEEGEQPHKKRKKGRGGDNISVAVSDSASQQHAMDNPGAFSQILTNDVSDTSSTRKKKEKAKTMDKFASFDLIPCVLPVKGNAGLPQVGEEYDDDDDEASDLSLGSDEAEGEDEDGDAQSENSTKQRKETEQMLRCLEMQPKQICSALRKKEVLQEIRNIVSRECNQAGITVEKMVLAHAHFNKEAPKPPSKVHIHPGFLAENGNIAIALGSSTNSGKMPPPIYKKGNKPVTCKQCHIKVWIEISKNIQNEMAFIPMKFDVNTSFDLFRQKHIVFGTRHQAHHEGDDDDEQYELLSDIEDDYDDHVNNQNGEEEDPADIDGVVDVVGKKEIWPSLAFMNKRDVSVAKLTGKKLQGVYEDLLLKEKKKRRAKEQQYKSIYFWEKDPNNHNWRIVRDKQEYVNNLLEANSKNDMVEMMYNANPIQTINNGNLNQKIDNANMVKRALEEKKADKSKREYVFPPHLAARMEEPEFKEIRDRIMLRRRVAHFIAEASQLQIGDEDDSVPHMRQQFEVLRELLNGARTTLKMPLINEEAEEIENEDHDPLGMEVESEGGHNEQEQEEEEEEEEIKHTVDPEGLDPLEAQITEEIPQDKIQKIIMTNSALRIDLRDFRKARLDLYDQILTSKELPGLIRDLAKSEPEMKEIGDRILQALSKYTPYELVHQTLPMFDNEVFIQGFGDIDDEAKKTLMHCYYQLERAELAAILLDRILSFIEETTPPKASNTLAKEREHEVSILIALRSWFDRDCLPVHMKRRRGLIIYSSRRGLGKTYLSTSFVNYDPNRYIMCSTRFTREQFLRNFMSQIYMMIIDDLAVDLKRETDVEMLKKLLTGQPCTIIDKYLNLDYDGGVPVILTTNNRKMFIQMSKSPNFQEDCVFIELKKYIGPPEFEKTSRVMTEIAASAETLRDIANYNPANDDNANARTRDNTMDVDMLNEDDIDNQSDVLGIDALSDDE